MKAARIHRYGSPDVIVIDEISRPEPGRGEVLVRVAARSEERRVGKECV